MIGITSSFFRSPLVWLSEVQNWLSLSVACVWTGLDLQTISPALLYTRSGSVDPCPFLPLVCLLLLPFNPSLHCVPCLSVVQVYLVGTHKWPVLFRTGVRREELGGTGWVSLHGPLGHDAFVEERDRLLEQKKKSAGMPSPLDMDVAGMELLR